MDNSKQKCQKKCDWPSTFASEKCCIFYEKYLSNPLFETLLWTRKKLKHLWEEHKLVAILTNIFQEIMCRKCYF